MRVKISWNSENLDVEGDYDKGTKVNPISCGEPASFEIETIVWVQRAIFEYNSNKRIDVTDLLCNNNIMAELEALCLQKIAEDYDNAEPTEDCLKAKRGDR